MSSAEAVPARFERPSLVSLAFSIFVIWFILYSLKGAGFSVSAFLEGLPRMGELLDDMFPPDVSRISSIWKALLETFQMALAGTVLGVSLSLPLGVLASRTQSPGKITYTLARLLVSFCRTVPNLVWALFFVATVGLGTFAGTLTIIVDTVGFCGRFFAEGIEEIDRGPEEALKAIGAGPLAVLCCAVFPLALPSFVNSALFSLEKAVRSSVVLGLVGAGGIGVELKVAMDMFRYSEAATIILSIFVLVIVVERLSAAIRKQLL
ncbi:MAG: phosphonate ABC transporter, permease protein PhnE [Candidatus Dadabacteria bacterium]|nr:MAG: phosphonate ABC transporter, permease protein PhnE [Candidatus Dadabacteria bacterium]